MQYQLVLMGIDVPTVLTKVHELKNDGLRISVDFDFKYCPPENNNFSGAVLEPKHCIFYFREDKYAVFYQLKWL